MHKKELGGISISCIKTTWWKITWLINYWLFKNLIIYRCIRRIPRIKKRIDSKDKKFFEKINVGSRKPTVMKCIYKFIRLLRKFSIYSYLKEYFDRKDESFLVEERYSFFFILALSLLVLIGPWYYTDWVCFALVIPIYRILDLLIAHLNILLLHSERGTRSEDGYIIIRHAQRWVIFLFADFLQIVMAFAMIYWVIDILNYDHPPPFHERFFISSIPISIVESIKIGVNALYFSLVTIVTLGYGDFYPTAPIWRFIVSTEILIGLFFLFFVFVIAVPTIRTKIDVNKKWKNKR